MPDPVETYLRGAAAFAASAANAKATRPASYATVVTPERRMPPLRLPRTARLRKKWGAPLRALTLEEVDHRDLQWPALRPWFRAHRKWTYNQERRQAWVERRSERRNRDRGVQR